MLVLSRKTGEKIQIGNHVTITVLGVRGGTVKVGIEAPRSVRVLRGELTEPWTPECGAWHAELQACDA